MGWFTKDFKLEPEKCGLTMSDKEFINAFLTARAINQNVSFYKMEDKEESFLNVFLEFLQISKENVTKL